MCTSIFGGPTTKTVIIRCDRIKRVSSGIQLLVDYPDSGSMLLLNVSKRRLKERLFLNKPLVLQPQPTESSDAFQPKPKIHVDYLANDGTILLL